MVKKYLVFLYTIVSFVAYGQKELKDELNYYLTDSLYHHSLSNYNTFNQDDSLYQLSNVVLRKE